MPSPARTLTCFAVPLLLFACLKGGTTGTPGTDDTGIAVDDGGSSGVSPNSNGGAGETDDTASAPTGATKGSGTDDSSGPSAVEGNPGDPCTLGSECLSGICPKTTKTCDGCLLAGGGCDSDSDCCRLKAASGVKTYCGDDGKCSAGTVRFKGEACDAKRDVCEKGSLCKGTGSYGKGPTHCTTPCTVHAVCATSPHGPICQKDGFCGHHDCTSSFQCKTSVSGTQCKTFSGTATIAATQCGCDTDADCPASAICHKFQGAEFAYCW